jgi:hypothetical protein
VRLSRLSQKSRADVFRFQTRCHVSIEPFVSLLTVVKHDLLVVVVCSYYVLPIGYAFAMVYLDLQMQIGG